MKRRNVSIGAIFEKGSAGVSSNLPIIDLSSFMSGNTARHREISEQVGLAAQKNGFFYLRNYGIPGDNIKSVFAESRRFFSLPSERKLEVGWDFTNRGYDGLEAQTFDPLKPADFKESFRFTQEPSAVTEDVEAGWAYFHNKPNKWPRDLPGFKEKLLAFLTETGDLVEKILLCLEESLKIENELFRKNHSKRNSTMRLIRYPAIAGGLKDGQARCGEHTDWGTVTLLFQEGIGGLEVQNRDGEWIAVPALEDCVLVNIGDMLQAWTEGKLVSTPHRVAAPSDAAKVDRYSIALFAFADFGAKLDIRGGITSGDYVLSKLNATQTAGKAT
jgi:isopenicillin N synthase-like dioxygenase